jgi:hypothetical protein
LLVSDQEGRVDFNVADLTGSTGEEMVRAGAWTPLALRVLHCCLRIWNRHRGSSGAEPGWQTGISRALMRLQRSAIF